MSIHDIIPNSSGDEDLDKSAIVESVLASHLKAERRRLHNAKLAKLRLQATKQEDSSIKNIAIYEHPSKDAVKQRFKDDAFAEAQEALENTANDVVFVPQGTMVGTTRRDITKLLTSLNVNLNVQLTKTDTHNLLATILTCNESQLIALQNNKKVPMAIKAVVKRIIDDAAVGNITVIERLWNRIFGDNMLNVSMPDGYQGIVPNVPVSREAYILIRETLIGHD